MLYPSTRPKKEKLVPQRWGILLILLALTMILSGACLERKNVTLQIGSQKENLSTYAFTVDQFLNGAGVTLGPMDRVQPALDTDLRNGSTVVVYRAVPVTVTAYRANVRRIFTTCTTVAGVLAETGIKLCGLDKVEPGLTAPVTAGMQINVLRIVSHEETKEVAVPFTTLNLTDPMLAGGTETLLQPGHSGLARQVWQVVYTDGAVSAATMLSEILLTAPRPAIMAVAQTPEVNRGGMPDRFVEQMTMLATAYAPTGNNTATGTVPELGTIAVDPRVIPLGTRLYVQGYGFGTALDTGGAIKGDRVDLFFDSNREASDWGARNVRIYVLS